MSSTDGKILHVIGNVCLCVWGLSSHSRIFHSYGDVTIAGDPREGLQNLTLLGIHGHSAVIEGSLACHICCDTMHQFIVVISEDLWHTYCRAFSSGAVTTCFYDLGLSRLGFEHTTFSSRGQHSSTLCHRRGLTAITILISAIFSSIYNHRRVMIVLTHVNSYKRIV